MRVTGRRDNSSGSLHIALSNKCLIAYNKFWKFSDTRENSHIVKSLCLRIDAAKSNSDRGIEPQFVVLNLPPS